MQVIPPKAPALPNAPKEYDSVAQEEGFRILRLYFSKLDAAFRQLFSGFNNYGSFYDTTTQQPAVINTPYPVTINSTFGAFGISVDATVTSRVKVSRPGVYSVSFLAQLDKLSGGAGNAWFWLRKNGVDVVDSGTHWAISGVADQKSPSWTTSLVLAAGDYIEVVWMADSTAIALHYVAATGTMPAVPSILVNMQYLFPNAAV